MSDLKKRLILNSPYLIFVYIFDKLAQSFRIINGDMSFKILHIGKGLEYSFSHPLPSLHLIDIAIGIAGAVIIRLLVYFKGKNAKKYRQGKEYGSARWGNKEDIKPYMDDDFSKNILLTQTERITMDSRPKNPKHARNKNVIVIGGSGSGKTRFFVKPNLMQMHSSYVVTDPKGTVINEVGKLLASNGYQIKVLNTINFKKSMHYNPFAYIRSEKDILDHQLIRSSDMRYLIETPKTDAGNRTIPISDEVCECFRIIIENRKKPRKEPVIEGYSQFLFLDKNDMPMVALHWEKYFQHILQKYNKIYKQELPKITPHVCRHTYCSNMAKTGINPKTLQYLMGHSDISVTLNTYTHVKYEDAKEDLTKMNLV